MSGSGEFGGSSLASMPELTSFLIHSCDDLTSQNALLHEHLETFSSQAAHLQARQAVGDSTGEGASTADQDSIDAITASHHSSVEQLRGVIRHLRSDKEVVDYQLQLAKTEATRLKTQLDYATRGLEEARQSLTEVRLSSWLPLALADPSLVS
jgi:nucleoprotein TPR